MLQLLESYIIKFFIINNVLKNIICILIIRKYIQMPDLKENRSRSELINPGSQTNLQSLATINK